MQNLNPLIVQSDRTLLLDVHAPQAENCRSALIPFAELERSPEHLHTYRISAISLWNAASAGFSPEQVISVLETYSRYNIPQNVVRWIQETAGRFGKLRIVPVPAEIRASAESGQNANPADSNSTEEYLLLIAETAAVFREISAHKIMKKYLIPLGGAQYGSGAFLFKLTDRGTIKQELISIGWPVKDEVPLKDGEPLDISFRQKTKSGAVFSVRSYQLEAAKSLVGKKEAGSGFGTIVLPCGSGKTIVGMAIMELLKTNTLILTVNISAVHQWINELLDKTTLNPEQIGEYSGAEKNIRPVTVATYQILTWRADKNGSYPHFQLFREHPWGLIIYDEVHLLPAPVFRVTAELQAVRRAGLTATLVREDGCEKFVFSLVGPKRYDVPWKELEMSGWIAEAECTEIRVDFDEETELLYAVSDPTAKYRIASENPLKNPAVKKLVSLYPDDKILIIGQYLKQLQSIAKQLDIPLITGKTQNSERDIIYQKFRDGEIRILAVSKIANFAIDLPDASMAIQISGTFGSRQEEAQRLGRILRPKKRAAKFFTLITRNTAEEDFASNRQKFLAEQGYAYRIIRSIDELDNLL
ncbi:MAG: DEAD/DEAH box helicase [Bacteroides sp.]|nr:DEAD/DEAH box helicase [Prevotella sp.]MCM1408798.1 DEAD/DEAH box helicase [Treponema brennaborense]MCM1470578.1 DEAD/DEAH box helicase [Bacteroides sp.]